MPVLPIKLTRGVPPSESFPTALLADCAATVLSRDGNAILQYGPSRGYAPLCQFLAQEAGVAESRVVIGQGSLQLQDLCARLMIRPGDAAYVEEPSYDRAVTVLRRAGAQVVGFPLADDGPDPDAVEARLRRGERPVLFYLIPDFQNPSGTVLSREKRQRLAELARQYDFWLVEDIPYRRLRYRGESLPALFDLAPERTIQMSSYSKLISPGLRVGYAIMPEPLVPGVARMAEDTYISPDYLSQALVLEFVRRGELEPQLARLRALYEPRLDAMLGALEQHMADQGSWRRPDGGFFVGLTLDAQVQAETLLRKAQEMDLLLTDGRGFFTSGGDNFVRLPFCALTPEEIHHGIARLAKVVRKVLFIKGDCENDELEG